DPASGQTAVIHFEREHATITFGKSTPGFRYQLKLKHSGIAVAFHCIVPVILNTARSTKVHCEDIEITITIGVCNRRQIIELKLQVNHSGKPLCQQDFTLDSTRTKKNWFPGKAIVLGNIFEDADSKKVSGEQIFSAIAIEVAKQNPVCYLIGKHQFEIRCILVLTILTEKCEYFKGCSIINNNF